MSQILSKKLIVFNKEQRHENKLLCQKVRFVNNSLKVLWEVESSQGVEWRRKESLFLWRHQKHIWKLRNKKKGFPLTSLLLLLFTKGHDFCINDIGKMLKTAKRWMTSTWISVANFAYLKRSKQTLKNCNMWSWFNATNTIHKSW